jgi:hypothetical protein
VPSFLFHRRESYEDNILTLVPKLFTTAKMAVKWACFYRATVRRHTATALAGCRRGPVDLDPPFFASPRAKIAALYPNRHLIKLAYTFQVVLTKISEYD